MEDNKDIQVERLKLAGIELLNDELEDYLAQPDEITLNKQEPIPLGYKRCGKCQHVFKLYKFNKNISSKLYCTGNCKECQKITAQKSYIKNKSKRDYKAYYRKNREAKLAQSRKYYENKREEILAKHQEYRQSPKGKKIMAKIHAKRRKKIKKNAGIPYTREILIERDSQGGTHPICILCEKPIETLDDMHIDHLIPIVTGGADCFTNVACTHQKCNLTKSKDAKEITTRQVTSLRKLSEDYIDKYPDKFPEFFV